MNESKNICKEVLWLNTHIRYQSKIVLFNNWIKSNIIFVGDLVEKDGIISMLKLKQKMLMCDGRFFQNMLNVVWLYTRFGQHN